MNTVAHVLAYKGHRIETVSPEASVLDAVAKMNAHRIGSVLVTDTYRPGQPYRPVGIFTERDVLVRVIAPGLDPSKTPVGDVMTRTPITVRASATIAEAMRVVTERRCRHLPVIDDTGLCGLISIGDLTKWVVNDQRQTIDDLQGYIARA